MSTELHHTEAHSLDKTDLPDGPSGRERDITGRWIARLEDQTRRFPRESLLMSYLLGALLQSFPGRGLLPKLINLTWRLVRPLLFGFAAWRLYQLVWGGRSSSGEKNVAVNEP
jgi:hypothetical protein